MTCSEFESQISNFINANIKYAVLEKFIVHLHDCKECYDELEIYYMTNIGLEKVDKDDSISYNFKGELEQIIHNYEKFLNKYTRFQLITKTITIIANIILLATIVIAFLMWFDILI